ncbi:phosphoribosyltransferase family protein [Frankia sp. KB5]|uniref:phosphoribosyltransferase n=1 Tax=Frankia sp. KB5 TaxID=683318 RepID=UPI000A1024C9|nr:phosphoribosyltransferase family protein [Frankia sp. KB5]ORT47309.1 hypothetical protein KBI5_20405 [Frankia sp. KB5]
MDADLLTWHDVAGITEALAAAVIADGVPDVVVGILRGGMVPAVLLAHHLGVRDVRALTITHTQSDGVNAPKAERPVLANPDSVGRLDDRDVLLVDDVVGSGDTLDAARSHLVHSHPGSVRTAVCLLNLANWPTTRGPASGDGRIATYVGREIRRWVVFPWEQP